MQTKRAVAAILLFSGTALFAWPVQVVELYQSQGCSSCPPANAALNAIADRKDVIALSFAVTYWDQLGWADRFAKPAFTARQRAYATAMRADNVYTPQMVLNGRTAFVGSHKGELESALRTAAVLPGTKLLVSGGMVKADAARTADVWLVRYDPEVRQVAIKAGENNGRTLPHRNIVTELTHLGKAGGAALKLPAAIAGEERVLLLQEAGSGAVLDAAKL